MTSLRVLRARQEVARLEIVVERRREKLDDTDETLIKPRRQARVELAERSLQRARERLATLEAEKA